MMRRIMVVLARGRVHQSWLVVAMCVGIVGGVVLGLVFRIDCFWSGWWVVLAVLLLLVGYVWPKYVLVAGALMVGVLLAFARVSGELRVQSEMGARYKVEAGLMTEGWVTDVQKWFAGRIEGLLPEREAALGTSYLLGMKEGLPKDLNEQLRVVGLTHIVVASGAHLSILVEVARRIFGKASRFAGLLFSMVFVVFFMAMVGWTPSIMRAGVMAILTLAAWYVGRRIVAWRLILMVAALTLMMNPMFVTSLGWLLSFASYAGIMMLGPGFCRFFYGERKPGLIGSTVLTTVAATMMTLPIILYYFGQVSLISVVANLLILPTLPLAMGLVFFTGVFAGLPGVEVTVAWCARVVLDFHMMVVGWLGEMKVFLVEIPRYQAGVFGIYGVIGVGIVIGLIWRKVVKLREDCKYNFLE